ncbi:MAG: bifunctional DNA-formamidopyrimidine glycosylase/DNA-(apurinic or apyrimidinic site) lyase [Deltaproteobacteria bacterium]|nr:bifunctional DNA-formamidopyrimidine glycosylase/DNA-(apurinic or apyrimidinic site) lyase [Deltaproteobacteria bacterium]
MPELPEVESIKRSLQGLVGKTIARFYFSRVAPVETTSPKQIEKTLHNKKISRLERRGKYLLLHTDPAASLVLHLGMTGKLLLLETPTPREKHTHMELLFSDGTLLRFIDPRRFGTISLACQSDGKDNPFLKKLGLEYNDSTQTRDDYIRQFRSHPKLSLKTALLHQGIIAGVGNIYACEALYRAKLDPRRLVQKTTDEALRKLLQALRQTLDMGIACQGTTLRDYQDGRGTKGSMQNFLQVYGREGKTALQSHHKVIRIIQNNRSTWFAPAVQK